MGKMPLGALFSHRNNSLLSNHIFYFYSKHSLFSGPSTSHCQPFLADGLGTEQQSSYHAKQRHRKRNSKSHLGTGKLVQIMLIGVYLVSHREQQYCEGNLCVFSHVYKRILGLTQKVYVLQRYTQ